jgi:hypothetical protein
LANSHPKWPCTRISKLAADRGLPEVDQSTVWRHLRGKGYAKMMPKRRPALTEKHIQKRFERCIERKNWDEKDWEDVVFSDESYFEYERNKVRMWGKQEEKL